MPVFRTEREKKRGREGSLKHPEGEERRKMLRTAQFACSLPKEEADALNAESGRVYTNMLVQHYRRYRKQGIWLSQKSGERMEDAVGGPTTLHAHSRDAAQQGFYKMCCDLGLETKERKGK